MVKNRITFTINHLILYILTGVVCGVIGTLFSSSISFVTNIRQNNNWLLFLLPLAGIISLAIYHYLKTTNMGVDQVIKSVENENVLSAKITPAIFCGSVLSHLCGASVGREGAALQLGGGTAVFLSRRFKLTREEEKILIYCGMAGVFSSVFGTPLAAAFFALEVVFVGHIFWRAVIPVLISSLVSYGTAVLLGANFERFVISKVPPVNFFVICNILLLTLSAVVIGVVFCFALKYSAKLFKMLFKNAFLRIAIGGIIIVLLTIALGTYDYNGAGMNIIEKIFNNNEVAPPAFAFKILFTCISVGAGYKGGEIVPTLFIGATLGALVGTLLGLPTAFAAALCMTTVFCCVTNCPLASIFLAVELFLGKGMWYIAVSVIISYFISGKISLYHAQKNDGFKALFSSSVFRYKPTHKP